jgi:quercetin dioxygenase-like cupin family protein
MIPSSSRTGSRSARGCVVHGPRSGIKNASAALTKKGMKVLKQDQLPWSEIAHELVGSEHGLDITLLFIDAEPGRGPALHRHPYAEIFIVQAGQATFTIEGEEQESTAGDILIAHANQAHAFVNSGTGPLRQIDIHLSPTFKTQWLQERRRDPS